MELELLGKLAEKFDIEDLGEVLRRLEDAVEKAKESEQLDEFVDKIKLMGEMLSDYKTGEYREVPYLTIAVSAFAILYIANPGDKIPKEGIPLIGGLSDTAVIGLVLYTINEELEKYADWKN